MGRSAPEEIGKADMGIATNVHRVLRPLGEDRAQPLVALRFRTATCTRHALEAGEEWTWHTSDEDDAVGVLVAETPLTLRDADDIVRTVPHGSFFLLYPGRDARLCAQSPGSVLGVWLPRAALAALEPAVHDLEPELPAGPLADGTRAFLDSLLTPPADSSRRDDALAETLLSQMVLGLVADAVGRAAEQADDEPGADEALAAVRDRHAVDAADLANSARTERRPC